MRLYSAALLAVTAAFWLDACSAPQVQQALTDVTSFASDATAVAVALQASAPVAASAAK